MINLLNLKLKKVKMEIIVTSSQSEKRRFGDLETAVEYISKRAYENFTVYVKAGEKTEKIKEEIRRRCYNVLSVNG